MSGNRWRQVRAVRKAVRSNLDGFSLFHFFPQRPILFTGPPLSKDMKLVRLLTRAKSMVVI